MKRRKKIVILSHCLLNVNAKVEGFTPYLGVLDELTDFLQTEGYGIIQLPCPEILLYGMKRWGMVKEQLSHLSARNAMREMLQPILYQIHTYLDSGYSIPFIIGVDGSPSCGVTKTCNHPQWKGELSTIPNLSSTIAGVSMVDEPGIFMEIFQQELSRSGLSIAFLAIDESQLEQSMENIKKEFQTLSTKHERMS